VLLLADSNRLWQVVNNLLDNAVKFTPAGGRITLDVEREGGAAVLRVRDTGFGIAPEDLPHVFERFYQADKARQRGRGGSGLGLSISQAIVEAHGGQITAESKPGAGTTFSVRLPGGESPWEPDAEAREHVPPSLTRRASRDQIE